MLSRVHISLDLASKIADGAIDFAKSKNFKPVTVVVIDSAANIIVQKRMDYCSSAGIPQYAYAKAYTCVSMSMSSRTFRDRYASSSSAYHNNNYTCRII